MLLDVVHGTESGGLVIIRDTACYSGRRLLKYYINNALKREDIVHVLGFDVPEQELCAGLDSDYKHLGQEGYFGTYPKIHEMLANTYLTIFVCVMPQGIAKTLPGFHFHNTYCDPLGWTKQCLFTVSQFSASDITRLIQVKHHAKAPVLVIDSLSWIMRHHNLEAICQELQKLKRGGAVGMIFALLHTDLHHRALVETICHLASTVINVTPLSNACYAVAKTTCRKKSGKVIQEEEFFNVTEDLALFIENKSSQHVQVKTDLDNKEVDPASNLTFNLRLSEVERQAKEKVALPFVFSEEKKTALLTSNRGSGRILYEPDANDDFDEEDPDDDLDV